MGRVLSNRLDDIRLSMMLLTRLPVGKKTLGADATFARALWAYPIAGAVVGLLAGAVFELAAILHIPVIVAAVLSLAFAVLLTGAVHEDGLADFCDGIGGGRDRARKLEIMRDSHIGTYGASALALSFLLRWSAISAIGLPGRVLLTWIAAGALSRAAIAVPLLVLSPARSDGLGVQAAFPPVWSAVTAGLIALVIAVLLLHTGAIVMIAAVLAAALLVTWLAKRHLQGHTGDVLGACALAAEMSAFVAASTGWFGHG